MAVLMLYLNSLSLLTHPHISQQFAATKTLISRNIALHEENDNALNEQFTHSNNTSFNSHDYLLIQDTIAIEEIRNKDSNNDSAVVFTECI
jgi:hypothetical protein